MAGPMPRRPLGTTGLEVTPIGLGLAALGRPAYIDVGRDEDLGDARTPEEMERRCHTVLDAAFDAGVRYLDAARSYGRAERFLASWLQARPHAAAEVTVGSKWGYAYVGDWRLDVEVHEEKDLSIEALRRQAPESLALLGPHLALYQVHSATLESGVLDDRAVLDDLRRLHDEQGIAIGMSVTGPRQADTVRRALERSRSPFRSVQATWNLLEPSVGEALAEAHDAGWGVIVKEALANGRLTSRGDTSVVAVLADVAARRGASVDAVALATASAQPWADVVLSGAVTAAQVRSNATAAGVALDPDDLAALGPLATAPEAYWQARAQLPWA